MVYVCVCVCVSICMCLWWLICPIVSVQFSHVPLLKTSCRHHDAFEGQTLLPLKRVCVNGVNVSVFVEGRDPALSGILTLYDISIASLTFQLILHCKKKKREKNPADIFGSFSLVSLTSARIFALSARVYLCL